MNMISAGDPLLKKIPINVFVGYLERNGWVQIDHPNDRIFLFQGPLDDDGKPLQLILPRNHDLEDAGSRLADAVNLLSVIQQENPNILIQKITTHSGSRQSEKLNVAEREQLEEQLRQAQKMEAVGRLAGGIAHDFNNLLTVINGYSDLLLRQLSPEDPTRLKIEEIKRAGERAAALTHQLLAFSRKQVLQPKVLDLNAVVADVAKMLQRLIGEDIELVLSLNAALGQVEADPGQIEQVLMNLVVNARDAMPNGGRVVVETVNVEMREEYAAKHSVIRPGHFVMLAVSDTGTGIDAETQAHIFEPFFTTKGPGKGTGLGLSTVYGIVKQSGGSVWVYSEVGVGTTFKVYLPQVQKGAEMQERSAPLAEPPGGNETVLLAEDEEAVRILTRDILLDSGYQVLEAPNGAAALEVAGRHEGTIHLLLTDMVMPEMSGRELADTLMRLRPDMKVLYMSGYTNEAMIHHGFLIAGGVFLQKPFTSGVLARKVREALETEQGAPILE